MLGGALAGQKKFQEAETLLVEGYSGMNDREAKIPPAVKPRLAEAVRRLVDLYPGAPGGPAGGGGEVADGAGGDGTAGEEMIMEKGYTFVVLRSVLRRLNP